jgi:hypothetical protein
MKKFWFSLCAHEVGVRVARLILRRHISPVFGVMISIDDREYCRVHLKSKSLSLGDQARQLLNENPDEIVELSPDARLTEQDDAARRTYLRELRSEDAVVEILSKKREDESSIVELSLDTNLIRFRSNDRTMARSSYSCSPKTNRLRVRLSLR